MLLELLRSSAARDPGRPVVVTSRGRLSAGELLDRAEAAAAHLTAQRVPRLACLIEDVGDLLAVISGASAAGVEICICPTTLDRSGIDELLAVLGHPAVATDRTNASAGPKTVTVEELTGPIDATPIEPAEDPGLLILTSGTTGAPKPTRQRWSRLLAGIVATEPGAVWLLTYNVHQYAGLQMLLHALVNDATLVVPESRRPVDVTTAIRTHGITHASGTPTFWRVLLVSAGDEAVPPLEQITLGGEVVPGELLDRLHKAFPAARITHIYAGTEFGSAIAVSDGQAGLPVALLDRGASGRAQIRVVDGELHVRSTVGMIGYLDDGDLADDWIATGDLVDEVEGRLVFTGRVNDRINVGGTKVSPHTVEAVVHGVPGVALAAAYGRPNPITGTIVALDVVPGTGVDRDRLKAAIRAACESLPPAFRPRLIKFVDELAQRGGKLTRPIVGDETLGR